MPKNDARAAAPAVVNQSEYLAEVSALRAREKAHMAAGDAIAAERRRLSMLQVDASTLLVGAQGPTTLLDVFEGRQMLSAY
jgi:predicted dithiol-disulfide oxidoreductase (DUF899 family)